MFSKDNSSIANCTVTLMKINKGEVPYSREKGIDSSNIGRPVTTVIAKLTTETKKMINKYETRAEVENAEVKGSLAQMGYFDLNVDVREVK